MLKTLSDEYDVEVLFGEFETADGLRVLGKVVFSENRIYLNSCLLEGHPAFRFVTAHEIGHWLLHRWRPIQLGESDDPREVSESEDTEDQVFSLRNRDDWPEPIRHLERQANVFAASIVMPRATFAEALASIQVARGITRFVGTLWVNRANLDECRLIESELASLYGVSRASVRIRLDTLGVLEDKEGLLAAAADGGWHTFR
jgi:Zn-dependent peptidase ImmA (M78 family)